MSDKLNLYSKDEIEKLLKLEERLVFVDDGIDEVIAKFNDLPDIIVDFNRDLKIYNFIEPEDKPIITTKGMFLDKCSNEDRQAIIQRLIDLQQNREKIKKYKVISEEDLGEYFELNENVKEMKKSIKEELLLS